VTFSLGLLTERPALYSEEEELSSLIKRMGSGFALQEQEYLKLHLQTQMTSHSLHFYGK
jgi:hypothetical protein